MNPTSQQLSAVESTDNQIFAISGPGSGKTRTLIWRVLHLIQSGVSPKAIACITFTNAGAREMEKRLSFERWMDQSPNPDGGTSPYRPLTIGFVGTLHAFMLNLIRQHGRAIGYPNGNFTILDNEEQVEFMESVVAKFKWKGTGIALSNAIAKGPPLERVTNLSLVDVVAAGYWQDLRRAKLLTFDAILILGERLLKFMAAGVVEGGALTDLPWDHFLIDEVQDSSPQDFRIYDLLLGNKFLVGDVDQSIYRFRGADPTLCLSLTLDPAWHVIPLEGNFRSGPGICRAAQSLIEHNSERYAKQTISAVDYEGEVRYYEFQSPPVEASFIAQTIGAESVHTKFSEMAVLVRTNDLVEEYATHLRAMSIPIAQSRQPVRPVDWARVRIILSFLAQPENDYAAYRCACFSVGDAQAALLKEKASLSFTSINQIWERFPIVDIGSFLGILLRFGVSEDSLQRIYGAIDRLPSGAGMPELLLELSREDEYVTGDGVTVCTIHAAKGREWDFVFLPAFEQQVIPSERKTLDLPEERRLAYVAVTRARRRLTVTWCQKRQMRWGPPFPVDVQPSQFVAEMIPCDDRALKNSPPPVFVPSVQTDTQEGEL